MKKIIITSLLALLINLGYSNSGCSIQLMVYGIDIKTNQPVFIGGNITMGQVGNITICSNLYSSFKLEMWAQTCPFGDISNYPGQWWDGSTTPTTSNLTLPGTYYWTGDNGYSGTSTWTVNITISSFLTVDNTVTISGNTIIPNETQTAYYRWLDCDNNKELIADGPKEFSPGRNGNFCVWVTVYEGSCSVTDTSDCIAFTFLDIVDGKKSTFKIYPSPAKNILMVEFNLLSKQEFIITDQVGKIVTKGVFHSLKNEIDISNLAEGYYIMKVGNTHQKFLVE